MKKQDANKTPTKYTSLNPKEEKSWTRKDYTLLTLNIMIKFGDAVEIYLPGVITQQVSCQMELSSLQEGFLAITLYLTMGATILVTAFLTDRLAGIISPILLHMKSSYSHQIIFSLLYFDFRSSNN